MHEPDATRPKDPSEPEAIVRAEAAIALGQYQEQKVLQALVAGLDDSELAVNQAALQSLQMHTGQDFQTDRAAWADWLGRTKEPFAAHGTYTYPRLLPRLSLVRIPPVRSEAAQRSRHASGGHAAGLSRF
jgi:hypothetical protein